MITIAGKPCSGKSAISKHLESEHGFERFSMGDMFRSIAKEYNMDVNELNQKCTDSKERVKMELDVDKLIDDKVKELGGKRIRDYVILESRTGFYFIPESHKVYTTILEYEQAKRLLGSGRDTEKTNISVAEAIANLNAREKMENDRYKELYQIDTLNLEQYDYVIDTTYLTIPESGEKVYDSYMDYRERKYGTKNHQKSEEIIPNM
ncbi:MAG: cytidylate kinase family protein [Clostridia bacterium]|nr:cytidylate kinase family protein [Clostridia bacterium]